MNDREQDYQVEQAHDLVGSVTTLRNTVDELRNYRARLVEAAVFLGGPYPSAGSGAAPVPQEAGALGDPCGLLRNLRGECSELAAAVMHIEQSLGVPAAEVKTTRSGGGLARR